MEEELISPIVYNPIHIETTFSSSQMIYDEHSNKIIIINKDTNEINIYAKNGKVFLLKRQIKDFSFNQHTILKLLLLRLDWCIILSKTSLISQITIINLNESKIFKTFTGDYKEMIGIFFLEDTNNNNNMFSCLSSSYFPKICIIYRTKMVFSIINKDENAVSVIQSVPLDKKKKFTYYKYNRDYMLLCVQRGDIENMDPKLVFHFYNLSNEKYYKKYGVLKIYVEKLSFSQKIQKRIEKYQWDKMNHQRKEHLITCSPLFKFSQFFLEKICNRLYFIWLSYADKKIIFYNLIDLENITENYYITFNGNESALQFFDNLLLLHDFYEKKTTVYDLTLKAQNKSEHEIILFPPCPISNGSILAKNKAKIQNINKHLFPNYVTKNKHLISMQSYNNTVIYSKMRKIQSKVIYANENEGNDNETLYSVYFDPEVYYEYKSNKKEAIISISCRKNGKYFILKILEQALKHNCYSLEEQKKHKTKLDIMDIQFIYKRICFLIIQSKLIMETFAKQTNINNINEIEYSDIIQPINTLFPKGKNIVSLEDLQYQTFKKIENDSKVIPEKAIFFHALLKGELSWNSINPPAAFYYTLLAFLKRVSQFYTIAIYFQNNIFGDISAIASYLINDVYLNNEIQCTYKEKQLAFQLGMDMYHRLHLSKDICLSFINAGLYREVFMVMKQYKLNIKSFDNDTQSKLSGYLRNYLNNE
jgi:hypothetical protein